MSKRSLTGFARVVIGLIGLGAVARAAETPPMTYAFFAALSARLMAGATTRDLEDSIPNFEANLATAREVSAAYWAESTPFDIAAKQYILPEPLLDALGISHETTASVMHVPAGVMHTYGYLFSQLQTPYGLKSKRWIESRLAERLGLPADFLSPFTAQGEFLSNLTQTLVGLLAQPGPEYTGHIAEHVSWLASDGSPRDAVITTHLVALRPLPDQQTTDTHLLIHEIEADGARRFVTAFPVDATTVARIAATPPSTGETFKPRYNLYIDPTWTVIHYETPGFEGR